MPIRNIIALLAFAAVLVLGGCPDEGDDDTSPQDDDVSDDDAGLTDCVYYRDADDDGYGDPEVETLWFCDGPPDGFVDNSEDCDDADPSVNPDAEEECNGIDDDCDGDTDEGFSDYDEDGVADCVDDECDAEEPAEEWIGILASCPWSGTPAADPWDVVVEWQWFDQARWGSAVMPVVANLSDDNGDGLIDERDTPDIVLNLFWDNEPDRPEIIALHGDGTGIIFEIDGNFDVSGVAVADIDQDGLPEVISAEKDYMAGLEVVSFDHEGAEEWRSEFFYIDWMNYGGLARHAYSDPTPTVADVDGDGAPEVVTQWAVFNGVDGSTEVLLDRYFDDWTDYVPSGTYFMPTIADLDRDGLWEILLEDSVYANDGT